jgi:hypothetical protein
VLLLPSDDLLVHIEGALVRDQSNRQQSDQHAALLGSATESCLFDCAWKARGGI